MNNIKPQMNPEEMFHMFDLKVLGDKIFYFKNVISFPKELMNTITDLDLNDQLSYKRIPQWSPWTASDDPNTIYGATKTILKNSTKIDTGSEYTNKRTLYIINSLIMAVEMCTERYFSNLGMDKSLFNLDIDQFSVQFWPILLKTILDQPKHPEVFIVYTPALHEKKNIDAVKIIAAGKAVHAFAKPLELLQYISQIKGSIT